MKKTFLIVLTSLIPLIGISQTSPDIDLTDPEVLLRTPEVPAKASAAVGRHIQTIEKWFKKYNFTTRTERQGEVLVVVIPAAELFEANEDHLKPEALDRLALFERAIINPEAYRILVWAHTDDAGDEVYSDSLSSKRAENVQSVFEQIAEKKGVKSNIFYTGFGADKPLKPNDSLANRNLNRRI
ncbi:MAG: OmpA family protein, partial [Muribaculaceae bacterium]|nr:OmpA family protein [Muribaculaceae bacterium]